MAQDDLRSFTMNGVLAGLLIFCLLSFAIGYIAYNNPDALGTETGTVFSNSYRNQSTVLYETPSDANSLLNITSNTNPEVSDLGSRDSVATSFSATGTGKKTWESAKYLIAWVFTGTTGELLLAVLGGLVGLLSYFFIVKHIRIGT